MRQAQETIPLSFYIQLVHIPNNFINNVHGIINKNLVGAAGKKSSPEFRSLGHAIFVLSSEQVISKYC